MAVVSAVSWLLRWKFRSTDITGSLRHLLNLVLTALKFLLVCSSGAFPSSLCLALKLLVLHSNIGFNTLWFCWSLEELQRFQLLGFEARANTLKGMVYWYRHWGEIFSACLYLLSHMQGESAAILHYIASNISFCSKLLNFPINYHSHVFILIRFF